MKRYLKIEHQDNDNELLRYLRKQAGLHQDEKYKNGVGSGYLGDTISK
jgi:hypothetical protein